MKKQLAVAGIGIFLVTVLFIFGRTVAPKSKADIAAKAPLQTFSISHFTEDAKAKLIPSQAVYLSELENKITRGDIPTQQIEVYNQLAAFWKDSAHLFEPYAYYTAASSKLVNSEKNLTFAAQLFLDNLRGEQDEAKLNWESEQAIELFEQAIKLNPANDELKIGLGSCYVYGKGRIGGPEETMKGIQQLLAVVRKDSTNMKAQLVLGVGGYVSGQYDKAVERLLKVVAAQPENLEAIAFLADAYAAKGDKTSAVKWYEVSKKLYNNPQYSKEVDERIKQLK